MTRLDSNSYDGWQDRECSNILTFICQSFPADFYCTEGPDCLVPHMELESPLTSERLPQQYVSADKVSTWSEANQTCNALGLRLFSIRSQQELQAFVLQSQDLDPDRVGTWMGLTSLNLHGMFSYMDGTYPTWANWYTGSPMAALGDCVMVGADGYFVLKDCKEERQVLCESDMVADYFKLQESHVDGSIRMTVFRKENITAVAILHQQSIGMSASRKECALYCGLLEECNGFTFDTTSLDCVLKING